MTSEILIEIGRVVLITSENKLAVILDIINQNRVIISGPTTGVCRQVINTSKLRLTKFRISTVLRNQRESKLAKKIEEFKLVERFNETNLGKVITNASIRKNLGDFDRFKVFLLKKKMNNKIRTIVNKKRKVK